MTSSTLLLVCLFGGLAAGGLRSPWAWTAASAVIWAVLLGSRRLHPHPFKAWASWLAWAALSVVFSDQPLKCLYAFSRWASVLAYFGLVCSLWGERERRLWFWGLCLAAPALGLAGLWTGSPGLLRRGAGGLMTGLLPPYYNYTAFVEAAMAGGLLFALGHPGGPKGKLRLGLWALLAFALLYLLTARARGALLAVLAAAVFSLFHQREWRHLLRGALILIAGSWLVATVAESNVAVSQRVSSSAYLLKLDQAQGFKRPQIWSAALKAACERPLLGEGPGNFAQGFRRHNFPAGFGSTNYQFFSDYAHSEPLNLAVETGWVGLALFLLAFSATMRASPAAEATWAQDAALGSLAAMAAHCLVDNMLHMPALAMLFFSAAACVKPKSPSHALGPWAKGAACLGLVLSLAAWIPGWLANSYAAQARSSGNPARRVEFLLKSVRIFPAESSFREDLARAYMAIEPPEFNAATRELEKASALDPTNALDLVMRAEILRARRDWPRVSGLAEQALALEPNFLQARLLRAETLARMGNKQAARRELAEIARLREELDNASHSTGYDSTVTSFDPGRFDLASRLTDGLSN